LDKWVPSRDKSLNLEEEILTLYIYLKITSQNYFNIWPLQNIKKRNIIIILVTENAFNRLKKKIL